MSALPTRLLAPVVFFLALGPASPVLSAGEPAVVVQIAGAPRIVRDGRTLTAPIVVGSRVEGFDYAVTDGGARFRVELGTDWALEALPSSSLSFGSLEGGRWSVELAGGTVEVEGSGPSPLVILTAESEISVLGGSFSVTAAADGSLLVVAVRGVAEVALTEGPPLFAVPGQAVVVEAGFPRNVVHEEPVEFRDAWVVGRDAAIARDAAPLAELHLARYRQELNRFERDYAALAARRDTTDRWMEEAFRLMPAQAETAGDPPLAEAGPPDGEEPLADLLERLRSSLLLLESALVGLQRFGEPPDEARLLHQRFATVRHLLKLAAGR